MPPVNYAVRLRAPYADLATTVADWAMLAEKLLCYEHPEENNQHCHFLLVGVRVTVETLKGHYRRHGLELRGAGQVSFKTTFKNRTGVVLAIDDETIPKYITYMSKGKYDPSYNKGYEPEFIEQCKSAWIDYKASEPVTRDKEMLGDFSNHLMDYIKLQRIDDIASLSVEAVRVLAFKFSVDRAFGVVNVQTRKDASMLYTSVCFGTGRLAVCKIVLPFEHPHR